MDFDNLSGIEKSAILLLSLGEEASSEIFSELSDAEVRMISQAMLGVEHVPGEIVLRTLEQFRDAQNESVGMFVDGDEFVRNAIAGSGDAYRAEKLIGEVTSGIHSRPLETISMMPPRMVGSLLENEHPQTVALILSTQNPLHTGKILSYLPDDMTADVMFRIARIDKVSPDVIGQIEEALQRQIGVAVTREQQQVGGVEKVVEILGCVEKGSDKNILAHIEVADPEMAEEIRKLMFTFDDLSVLDNRSLQMILREVNNDTLTLALKVASEDIKEKIFSNISERAADMIKEDLEAMGPTKLSDVEAMQQVIVKVALKLEEEGQLVIPGRGGSDELV